MEIRKNNESPDWRERYEESLLADCTAGPTWEQVLVKLEKAEKAKKKPAGIILLITTAVAACVCGVLFLVPALKNNHGTELQEPIEHVVVTKTPGGNINNTDTASIATTTKSGKERNAVVSLPTKRDSALKKILRQDIDVAMQEPLSNDTLKPENNSIADAPVPMNTKPSVIPLKIFNKHLAEVFRQDPAINDSIAKPYLRKYKVKSLTAPEEGRVFTNDHIIHSPL